MAYKENAKKSSTPKGLNRTEGTEFLSGELYYARLAAPLTKIETREGTKEVKPQFKLSLALSKAQVDKAEQLGLQVNEPTDSIPKPFVVMRRMIKDMDDVEASRPRILDENNEPHDLEKLIGNGSRAQVLLRVFGDEEPKAAAIIGVQIQELIEYERKEKEDKPKGKATAVTKQDTRPSTNTRKPVSYSGKPKDPQPVADDADLDDETPF